MQNSFSLIFVYNANSGIVNAIKDCTHKIFSPKTYPCKLCTLTYDYFSENNKWKKFRTSKQFTMFFLHRDEFYKQYGSKFLPSYDLPVILIKNGYDLDVFIANTQMQECKNVDEFIALIERNLELSLSE